MARPAAVERLGSDDVWRLAVLLGVPGVAAAVAIILLTTGDAEFTPLWIGAAVGGVLYEGDKQGSKAVGFRVGLLGVVAVALQVYTMLPAGDSGAMAAWTSAGGLAIVAGLTGMLSAVLILTTMVSAMGGHWLGSRLWERSSGGDATATGDRPPVE